MAVGTQESPGAAPALGEALSAHVNASTTSKAVLGLDICSLGFVLLFVTKASSGIVSFPFWWDFFFFYL